MNTGLVHAPYHDLASNELLYLVEEGNKVTHPKTGPVKTDDLADSMINVTYTLLYSRDQEEVFQQLGSTTPRRIGRPATAATITTASGLQASGYPAGSPQDQLSALTRRLGREAPPDNPARGRRGRRR